METNNDSNETNMTGDNNPLKPCDQVDCPLPPNKATNKCDDDSDEDWDSFDPMADDYYNPTINSYLDGPAAKLPLSMQSPAFRNMDEQTNNATTRRDLTTLFIPDIPTDMDQVSRDQSIVINNHLCDQIG